MAKQVWQATDGKLFSNHEDAETHDMVCEVTTLIHHAYISHGGQESGFAFVMPNDIKNIADILVNTDVLPKLVDYAKRKELI